MRIHISYKFYYFYIMEHLKKNNTKLHYSSESYLKKSIQRKVKLKPIAQIIRTTKELLRRPIHRNVQSVLDLKIEKIPKKHLNQLPSLTYRSERSGINLFSLSSISQLENKKYLEKKDKVKILLESPIFKLKKYESYISSNKDELSVSNFFSERSALKVNLRNLFPLVQNHVRLVADKLSFFVIDCKGERMHLKFSISKCPVNCIKGYFSNITKFPNKNNCFKNINPIICNKIYQFEFRNEKKVDKIYCSLESEIDIRFEIIFSFGKEINVPLRSRRTMSLLENLSSKNIRFNNFENQIKDFLKNPHEMKLALLTASELLQKRQNRWRVLYSEKSILNENKNAKETLSKYISERSRKISLRKSRTLLANSKRNERLKTKMAFNEIRNNKKILIKMKVL